MTSRREFLSIGLGISAGFALGTTAARATEAACYDPASLPLSQRSRRRALAYTDQSGDGTRRCGLCAFFTGTAAGCGTCQMLSGGTVSASGVCSSFAPRPAN